MVVFAIRYQYRCGICGYECYSHVPPIVCLQCAVENTSEETGRYYRPREVNQNEEMVRDRPSRKARLNAVRKSKS